MTRIKSCKSSKLQFDCKPMKAKQEDKVRQCLQDRKARLVLDSRGFMKINVYFDLFFVFLGGQ